MQRSSLESVIEALLDKIADANGYGKGRRSRYQPLRDTNYTKVRATLFPQGQLPATLMSEELFLGIKSALKAAKGPDGRVCLSAADLEQLEQARKRYKRETLTAPDRLHAHWTTLAATYNVTPKRLKSQMDIYWCLYPILYEPMLRGDAETFNQNNLALLSAFNTGSAALPADIMLRTKVWGVLFDNCRVLPPSPQSEGGAGCMYP